MCLRKLYMYHYNDLSLITIKQECQPFISANVAFLKIWYWIKISEPNNIVAPTPEADIVATFLLLIARNYKVCVCVCMDHFLMIQCL